MAAAAAAPAKGPEDLATEELLMDGDSQQVDGSFSAATMAVGVVEDFMAKARLDSKERRVPPPALDFLPDTETSMEFVREISGMSAGSFALPEQAGASSPYSRRFGSTSPPSWVGASSSIGGGGFGSPGAAWSPLLVSTRSLGERATRTYEVQVCCPVTSPQSSGSRYGLSDAGTGSVAGGSGGGGGQGPRRSAAPAWVKPVHVKRDTRSSKVGDNSGIFAPAGVRFPQLQQAGAKVPRPQAQHSPERRQQSVSMASVDPYVEPSPATPRFPRELRAPAGRPLFRSGAQRPRLLERKAAPIDGGKVVSDWSGGLRGSPSPTSLAQSLQSTLGATPSSASGSPASQDVASLAASTPLAASLPSPGRHGARSSAGVPASPAADAITGGGAPGGGGRGSVGSVRSVPGKRPDGHSRYGSHGHSGRMGSHGASGGAPGAAGAAMRKSDGSIDENFIDDSSVAGRHFRSSVLWKLPKSERELRMKRLEQNRKRASAEDSGHSLRDRMSKRQEVELAQESFGRYFELKKENHFDSELVIEALSDFGIRGGTRPEKTAICDLIAMYPKTMITFGDFCTLAEDAKAKMRQLHSASTHQAWRLVDHHDEQTLTPEGVMQVFVDLGLVPPNPVSPSRFMAETFIGELQADENTGLIDFHEAEFAIEEMRHFEQSTRRRKEREIQRSHDLDKDMFEKFRPQLLDLYDNFNRLDEDSSGSLDVDEILNLLSEFGFVTEESKTRTWLAVYAIAESHDGDITFPVFLQLIQNLRDIDKDMRKEEVRHLFNTYDRDRSGELDMKETCALLLELGLQPRTVREQRAMAELLEEVDKDGSGKLNYLELLTMVQRVSERIVQIQRTLEAELAHELGIAPSKFRALRKAFDVMAENKGGLSVGDVERALGSQTWVVSSEQAAKLMAEVDSDGNGIIDFTEFLHLMATVEEERKAVARKNAEEAMVNSRGGLERSSSPTPDSPPHQEDSATAVDSLGGAAPVGRQRSFSGRGHTRRTNSGFEASEASTHSRLSQDTSSPPPHALHSPRSSLRKSVRFVQQVVALTSGGTE